MHYLSAFSVALFSLALLLGTGCGSNPTLSQPAYQQALALFNALSRKDENALAKLQELITKSKADSEISAGEADLLLAVIENAKQGNWDSATARIRKLMEKQAVTANPTPGEIRPRHRH